MRRTSDSSEVVRVGRQTGGGGVTQSRARNSVLTLTAIVLLYLLCNSPRLTLNTAEYWLTDTIFLQVTYCYFISGFTNI